MAYLPKHYVKTGLTANPGEYIDRATGQPYTGPYYAIATGQYFGGVGPQDPNAKEIIPFGDGEVAPGTQYREVGIAFNLDVVNIRPGESSFNVQNQPSVNYQVYQPQLVNDYTAIKKYQARDFQPRVLPYGVTPIPDSSDYKVGEYRRYFCKKTNQNSYLEIDQQQYTAISSKDPKFFWEQYFAYSLPWALTGEQPKVYRTNRNIVQERIINLKLFGFDRFLQEDYTKFYRK
jgi:hypothetical protein